MTAFPIHSPETAPEKSRAVLAEAAGRYGFVPNLIGAMSEAPAAAEAYMALGDALRRASFTPVELHVVWFTINALHRCDYCMAAHTGIALKDGVPGEVIETARAGGDYADAKLQALKVFTTAVVQERGWVGAEAVEAFLAAGYTRQTVLEVVLAVSHKVLSNYTNHLVGTPVDEVFGKFAWQPAMAAE